MGIGSKKPDRNIPSQSGWSWLKPLNQHCLSVLEQVTECIRALVALFCSWTSLLWRGASKGKTITLSILPTELHRQWDSKSWQWQTHAAHRVTLQCNSCVKLLCHRGKACKLHEEWKVSHLCLDGGPLNANSRLIPCHLLLLAALKIPPLLLYVAQQHSRGKHNRQQLLLAGSV